MFRARSLWLSSARQVFLPRHPERRLALLFLALIWIGGVLLHLPICARREPLDWSAAFFTATSAICVTGLTVFDVQSTLSFTGQVVLLILVQLGGLGYMLAATLLLLLFRREPRFHERLLLRSTLGHVTLRDTVMLVWRAVIFTFCVEAVGAAILTARLSAVPGYTFPRALWHGVFHSVTAFTNAGFDLFSVGPNGEHSLIAFRDDPVINFTVAALIFIGGLGFAVYQEFLYRWRHRRSGYTPLSLHTRVVLGMSVWLVVAGAVALLITEWTNPSTMGALTWPQKIMAGGFQSVALRSGGYSTLDWSAFRSISLLIGAMWMFVGAAPGGTSGGVKITTFAVMLAAIRASLRGRNDVDLFHRRLPTTTVYRALVLVFVSLVVVGAGIFVLTFTEPDTLVQKGMAENLFVRLQFEAISAFGTVGASTGITPHVTDAGRVVLMALMFLGRLGPIVAATALTARHSAVRRRLPEEDLALG